MKSKSTVARSCNPAILESLRLKASLVEIGLAGMRTRAEDNAADDDTVETLAALHEAAAEVVVELRRLSAKAVA